MGHILTTDNDSRVMHTLIGTDDMTHGTDDDSQVMHILMGTEDMTHGYWWYDSQVTHILTGTANLTGTAYSFYRVNWFLTTVTILY